jgi:hypothetical protein
MDIDKLIVSNRSALEHKYGKTGLGKINAAVKKMIAADKKKNLKSLFVFVDDKKAVSKAKAKAVTDVTDAGQYKEAIDKLYDYYTPDYILLLGAQDVIPHCRFRIVIPDDDDSSVPSDVPYACSAPFSRDPGDFIAPSRVLGRLPDITGGNDPRYLTTLIENSTRWKPLKAAEYKNYFSLSVKWWKKSTLTSLQNIFQDSKRLELAPPEVGPYSKSQLASRLHFFNCHGGLRTAEFYGQPSEYSNSFPVCFNSDMIHKKITYGTVIAAECCYGGWLYNPYKPNKIDLPISNTYLLNNAIGYAGSTTAAYGPAEGQGGADYITQYFLISVRKGASIGRAFLEAQQRFVEKGDVKMDPTDLKTIIQFLLLGDPSVTPVAETPKMIEGKTPVKAILNKDVHDVKERKERRMKLAEKSVYIGNTSEAPVLENKPATGTLKKELQTVLKRHNFPNGNKAVYGFRKNKKGRAKSSPLSQNYRYHVFSKAQKNGIVHDVRLLVVQEINNKVMEVKEYVRR